MLLDDRNSLWPINQPFEQNIRPGWIGDFLSREHVLAGGVKGDPSLFVNSDATKVTTSAAALAGEVSIPVIALPNALAKGSILNFGGRAAVVVTLTANAAADAVSIAFTALTDAIPADTLLDFGGKKFARTTAVAAKGAVSVAVSAIPTALVIGDVATVPAVTARTAKLTVQADKNAVSLDVEALPEGLESGAVAYYSSTGDLRIHGGTVIGLTNAELENAAASGVLWGPAADTDDVVRLTVWDARLKNSLSDATSIDLDVLRPGTLIYVNFLPGWADLSVAIKNKIRTTYEVSVATPGQEVPQS